MIKGDVNEVLLEGYIKYSEKNANASRFDFVFIDPPYKSKAYFSVLTNLIKGDWIQKNTLAICEFSTKDGIDIPSSWIIKSQKSYGKTGLLFLIPNLA